MEPRTAMGKAREQVSKALGAIQGGTIQGGAVEADAAQVQDVMASMAAVLGALFEGEKAESDEEVASQAREVGTKLEGILGHLAALGNEAPQLVAASEGLRHAVAYLAPAVAPVSAKRTLLMGSMAELQGASPSRPAGAEVSAEPTTEPSDKLDADSGDQDATVDDEGLSAGATAHVMSEAAPLGAANASPDLKVSEPAPRQSLPPPVLQRSGSEPLVEVNIGAATASNFFVGFSGEVRHGGVFVATYAVKPKDSVVELFVTLPGGYDFKSLGVVRFVRDPLDLGANSEPGMGVQLAALSEEQEALIQRFIKKRAPFFYDA